MSFRTFLISIVISVTSLSSWSQDLHGRYKGQLCFRHCQFFKLNLKENGTFIQHVKGPRSSKTEHGLWTFADGILEMKVIDSDDGAVAVYRYAFFKGGFWIFDEETREPIEQIYKPKGVHHFKTNPPK
jgi:hypothetical protein